MSAPIWMYGNGDVASVTSLGLPVNLTVGLNVSADEVATGASASVTGGCSVAIVVSSASSTYPTLIKNAPGRVYGYELINLSTLSAQYVKLHDSNVTPTSTTALNAIVTLPTGSSLSQLAPRFAWFDQGISFTSGIGFRMTRNAGATNDQSVGTGEMVAHIFYK